MSTTAVRDVVMVEETTALEPTAHLYCYLCFPVDRKAGNVAFCGYINTGTSNPDADRCVVCLDLENGLCPTCGV